MNPIPHIEVIPKDFTDADWLDAITVAMQADLGTELRRRVVTELLELRRRAQMMFVVKADAL